MAGMKMMYKKFMSRRIQSEGLWARQPGASSQAGCAEMLQHCCGLRSEGGERSDDLVTSARVRQGVIIFNSLATKSASART